MSMQKFHASTRDAFTWPNGATGFRTGAGAFDCLGPYARVKDCPIEGTNLRLTCYATGYADTAFSVPACTRTGGRYIAGYFTLENAEGLTSAPDAGCVFRPMDRHASRVPTARAGDLLRLHSAYLQHKRFSLVTDSQDIRAVCDSMGIPAADISGLLVHVGEGEYLEIWETGYQRAHELTSFYRCVQPAKLSDVRAFDARR